MSDKPIIFIGDFKVATPLPPRQTKFVVDLHHGKPIAEYTSIQEAHEDPDAGEDTRLLATDTFTRFPGSTMVALNANRIYDALSEQGPIADELRRLQRLIHSLDQENAAVYRNAIEGHIVAPCPVIRCPKCHAPDLDLDGFGCLACPRDPKGCWCSHPSRDGNICTICGDVEYDGMIVDDGPDGVSY